MTTSEHIKVTVPLTEEHLAKMVENHLLGEDEMGDQAKLAQIVSSLLDRALGLPEKPWHDWDDWAKGLQ